MQSTFAKSEKHDDLLPALLTTILPIRIGPRTILRTDTASGVKRLQGNKNLTDKNIFIELGLVKNKNSLAVNDRAQQMLQEEIRKIDTSGNKISAQTLAEATYYVNMRLRPTRTNLSAKEILLRRDQFTGDTLDVNDDALAAKLHSKRNTS